MAASGLTARRHRFLLIHHQHHFTNGAGFCGKQDRVQPVSNSDPAKGGRARGRRMLLCGGQGRLGHDRHGQAAAPQRLPSRRRRPPVQRGQHPSARERAGMDRIALDGGRVDAAAIEQQKAGAGRFWPLDGAPAGGDQAGVRPRTPPPRPSKSASAVRRSGSRCGGRRESEPGRMLGASVPGQGLSPTRWCAATASRICAA